MSWDGTTSNKGSFLDLKKAFDTVSTDAVL